ncbi:MAG: 2-amino-4-hydroxy-6-hydroxymethyldihydropteridine diphosphokinase [Planctomycetota bacterium]|nr:2-amino-4-hydroxy-6-hydroxymethyldihydropteridine diphosphokinase [Planctomycetota bacterium]
MGTSVAYIGLGSNLGDQAATLMRAVLMLDQAEGVHVRRISQLIRTEAVGGPANQPAYVNGAAEIETSLAPGELLGVLQSIESALGRDRRREPRWGPRTCDLDVLLIGEEVVATPTLTVPHPRMHERLFVLEPLASIAPQALHPGQGRTVSELLADARAAGPAPARPTPPPGTRGQAKLVSLIGPVASGKTTLAELLAMELPAALILEDFEGNPFLPESYVGETSARLPAQLYYLMSRVKQLARTTWPEEGVAVADYGLCQDRLFARMRLPAEEFPLYEQLWEKLSPLAHAADLLISLDCPEEFLLARIAQRGRGFERAIDAEFLAAQRAAYETVTAEAACPVLRVDGARQDIRRPSVRAELIRTIREMLT